jgi:HEPN domain-containing protein
MTRKEFEDLLQPVINRVLEGKTLEESIEEWLVKDRGYDRTYAKRKAREYLEEAREIVKGCLQKAELVFKIEEPLSKVGLDFNWMMAAVCFAIQDVLVRRVSKKLGIPLLEGNKYKNIQRLIEEIKRLAKSKGIRTLPLEVAKQWNMEYRNSVIHNGQRVSEKEARRIMDATNDLLDELEKVLQQEGNLLT